jgi:hypothetical protein
VGVDHAAARDLVVLLVVDQVPGREGHPVKDDARIEPIATDWIRVLRERWGEPLAETSLAAVFEIPE